MSDGSGRRRQGVLQGMTVTLLAEGVAVPAGLITAAILTRDLGPAIYGRFAVVASLIAFTEWLLIAIFARPVVKFVAEADDWRPVAATAFRAYIALGVAAALFFWTLAEPLASLLNDPALAEYFRLFAPQIPVFSVGLACRNVLSGQALFREQAVAGAAGWIGRVVFIVLFLSLGYGIRGAIFGSICGTLAGALVALSVVRGAVWGPAEFPLRELMTLALPAFLAMLAGRVSDQIGLLAVEALVSTEAEVGFYGAAMNVMMLTTVIAAASSPVLISSLSAASHVGDEDKVRTISANALRLGTCLLAFAAIVAGAADEIVVFLFGADFSPATVLLALLVFAAVGRAIIAIVSAILIALGWAWTAVAATMPLLAVVLAGHLYFVPRLGAVGAARVAAAGALLFAVIGAALLSWLQRLSIPLGTLVRTALLGAGAYALAAGVSTPGMLVLVKAGVLAILVTAGFLVTGEVGREDLDRLRSSVQAQRS